MLEYQVEAHRIDARCSEARAEQTTVALDTGVGAPSGAFNPAQLLLAALAGCMIKGIERVSPLLDFKLSGVQVKLHGVRQDSPPRMVSIDYELIVDTLENDQRLELLHTNVRKFGTISNTLALSVILTGRIRRAD
jgi:uncharacterized OsmC-like protein